MAGLSAELDALADDDLHALDDGALLARTAELVQARNRLDAELARTVHLRMRGRRVSTTG